MKNYNKDEPIIWPQDLNTYLGNKGYTIQKSELSIKLQLKLKEMLMVKPYVPGSPVVKENTFPAYRESDKKIYIPRYFGENLFGKAKTIKISEGTNIDLTFNGTLREYQVPVVDKYLQHTTEGGGGLLELPCGFGKCLAKGTKIIMFNGETELVENIKIGDLIMGDDSTPRKILSLARGREQMYKISNKKGDEYICNESHILSLKCSTNFSKKLRKGDIVDISVKDFLNLSKSYHGRGGPLVGYKVGIKFQEVPISFDPYLLGYWLGDGSSSGPKISTQEGCIIKYIVDLFKNSYKDLYLSYNSQYDYRICSLQKNNRFMTFLRNKNLLNNKHIPHEYKCNNREIQLRVLAGLIDSDGYYYNNCYEITQKNSLLAEDIVYLCRSLGFACYSKKCKKTCYNAKNGPKEGEYNRITLYGSGLEDIPVLCKRKKASIRKQIKDSLVSRINIEKLEIDDYYGFEIDGNKRFMLGDFTVTHNTSIGLNIIHRLNKKTLVIVHKEFLMNQWIERIQQFLPNARIGKIQGQVIDIDNKDIVIAMLQSLSMKDYPSTLFDTFGFTIIDEVHHISSEVFSCALFKLVTKYMLGLSATMNRKDGTTKVFKMFLGEVVYKLERSKDENVIVRGITFKTNDDEFNELELDFRGQTASSKMLSKICNYNRRSDFIIKVLKDMIIENPKQQIMIIASYKNILNYMFEAIKHHNICTVGYYVGGMKESALKESESKQVVLATYSMAAEGLDIKSLSTLFMITPMTNIEQSVGRILRQKHEFEPIVVDIIDSHDNFQRQWLKRKSFYKKQNYKIIQTSSDCYSPDALKWKVTYEPTTCIKKTKTINNINLKKEIVKISSRSSSDKSIAEDTESEDESEEEICNEEKEIKKDKLSTGVCLLKFKK
jgi:superfamily II DNA or RNA helicase